MNGSKIRVRIAAVIIPATKGKTPASIFTEQILEDPKEEEKGFAYGEGFLICCQNGELQFAPLAALEVNKTIIPKLFNSRLFRNELTPELKN